MRAHKYIKYYKIILVAVPVQNEGAKPPHTSILEGEPAPLLFLQNQARSIIVGKSWNNSKIIHFGHVAGGFLIL